MTQADTAKYHQAMTAANGDRAVAAAELGIAPDALAEALRSSPELAALWLRAPAEISSAEAYDRGRAKPATFDIDEAPAVCAKDAALAEAYERQEQKLRTLDWEGLGVTDSGTLGLMRQFEGFAGGGLNRTLDAMYGGMCFCFAQVSQRFAQAAKRLQDASVAMNAPTATPEQKKVAMGEYAYWHEVFMDYAREMQKFNKEATNAGHTRLLIADKAKKMKTASERLRKPAWQTARKAGGTAGG